MTPFHLVDVSPWPLLVSLGAFGLTFGGMYWWHYQSMGVFILGMSSTMGVSYSWFKDVVKENMGGFHNSVIMYGVRFGMMLFILSEIVFFFSFFWSYFHKCWGPQAELGFIWPPHGFDDMVIDPFSMPLLNTVMLLSSGASMTWAHHSLIKGDYNQSLFGLGMTSFLGCYFLFLQGTEYFLSCFSINSTVYGTVFFMLTGFHGFHVTMGTMFLFVCFFRNFHRHFSNRQHVGFEAAAWYWHFVDVVWLFLYVFVYWYGFNLDLKPMENMPMMPVLPTPPPTPTDIASAVVSIEDAVDVLDGITSKTSTYVGVAVTCVLAVGLVGLTFYMLSSLGG